MPRPFHIGCLALMLSAALGAGCSTSKTVRSADATSSVASPDSKAQEPDAVIERRAAAHASYANGVVLEMQNRRTRALEAFKQAAELQLGDEELVWEVCRRFIAARKAETAAELLTLAAEQPDASGLTWARLGVVELQLGRTEKAILASTRAIERDPGVLQGHQTLFLTCLKEGDLERARKTLDAAETHADSNAEYLIQLAELYGLLIAHEPSSRETLKPRVVGLLQRASDLPIEDSLLRLRLADGFKSIGETERAAGLYQDLLVTMPDVPGARDSIRAKLAEIYLGGADRSRAAIQLEKLLEADPTNVRARYLLGHLAYEEQELERAQECFKQVIVLDEDFEQAYYDLAGVLLALDRVDEAATLISQARHKFPQNFSMEFLDALTHMRQEQYGAALSHFTAAEISAQALDPKRLNHFFYFQYGAASEQAGDIDAAERHLRKCLELKPDFAQAQNYLGYMWADRAQNLDEALTLIQQAVAAEPENSAYLDSLAWVLFRLGRVEEALPAIRKSIEHIEEPDAVVYDHLGDILAALNQPEEAAEAWRKSYELEAKDAVREKLEKAGQPLPSNTTAE